MHIAISQTFEASIFHLIGFWLDKHFESVSKERAKWEETYGFEWISKRWIKPKHQKL